MFRKIFFSDVILLLRNSNGPGDVAWLGADRRFNFREIKETCIGYGGNTIHGNAIGRELRARLLSTAKQIVDLGVEDPQLFALLSLLEEGIGADRISDMTTCAILPAILNFNASNLEELGIHTSNVEVSGTETELPLNPYEAAPTGILLLPIDILRDLPIANDWSDIADAARQNQELRDDINAKIGNIWEIRTRRDKENVRRAVLENKEAFDCLMAAVGLADKAPYVPIEDRDGHFIW